MAMYLILESKAFNSQKIIELRETACADRQVLLRTVKAYRSLYAKYLVDCFFRSENKLTKFEKTCPCTKIKSKRKKADVCAEKITQGTCVQNCKYKYFLLNDKDDEEEYKQCIEDVTSSMKVKVVTRKTKKAA